MKKWVGSCGCEDCATSGVCHSNEAYDLRTQLAALTEELEEQARIVGKGAEREMALIAERDRYRCALKEFISFCDDYALALEKNGAMDRSIWDIAAIARKALDNDQHGFVTPHPNTPIAALKAKLGGG